MKVEVELIEVLRYKIRIFGIPLEKSQTFGKTKNYTHQFFLDLYLFNEASFQQTCHGYRRPPAHVRLYKTAHLQLMTCLQ